MSIKLVLFILAFIFFLLDGFRVTTPRVSWTSLGFAALTAALFLPIP